VDMLFAHFFFFLLGGTFWSNHVTSLDNLGHEAQQPQLSRGSNTYFRMEESSESCNIHMYATLYTGKTHR
jgi:hypothetical protein